jgi:hypothetical protein
MADTLPDRLSTDPSSPYFNEELLQRGVGIRFRGQEKTNVEEYCVSEGWVRVSMGKAVDRRGPPADTQARRSGRTLSARRRHLIAHDARGRATSRPAPSSDRKDHGRTPASPEPARSVHMSCDL